MPPLTTHETVSSVNADICADTNLTCPLIPATVDAFECDDSETIEPDLTGCSLKCLLSDYDTGSFLRVTSSKYLTFVQLSDELTPRVRMSLVIDDNCAVHIAVFEKPLSKHHALWQQVPDVIKNMDEAVLIFDVLSKSHICDGAGDAQSTSKNILKNISAIEGQCGRIRSNNCDSLLSPKINRCLPCRRLKKQIHQRNYRHLKCIAASFHAPNKFLQSPFTRTKLTHLARMAKLLKRKNKCLQTRLERCKKMCQNMVRTEGQKLTDSDNNNMMQIATECSDKALHQFPPGSFQRIFWEQQLQYNKLKNKSEMRWHPSMIRWCLYLKSKSTKAYEGVRSYLSLPSNRTLFDYSHYTEHKLGVNPKVIEQLMNTARKMDCYKTEHRSFVGLIHDEIKIKSDLVYNKSTGELIGYVRLDNVTNELLKLSDRCKDGTPVAKNLLVVMVRGITTNLRYPLAAYATTTLSASTLYNVMWECVEYIELVASLKVLFICCDGAIQNRKCFNLHAVDSDFVYKTENRYASDDRDIYFVSDPPHLLKTARNCFANSFAHTDIRHLWFHNNISWAHVEKLFEEKCCKSEYSLCPKLTRQHISLTSFSKMRVNLAAQVLSATVANALEHCYGTHVVGTVHFIRMMNTWFDLLNVKHLYEAKHKRNDDLKPYTDLNDPRLRWLEEDFLKYFDDWKNAVESRPGNFTKKQKQEMMLSRQTVAGLRITCQSVPEIVRIVLAAGAPFVLTSHINQDPLEQLFGHCRYKGGSNNNPSVAEACHAINSIRTVSTQAVSSSRGNTEPSGHTLDVAPVPKRKSS